MTKVDSYLNEKVLTTFSSLSNDMPHFQEQFKAAGEVPYDDDLQNRKEMKTPIDSAIHY